jgi:2-amino-4-hydroxy-6-hydroxymethyldihydropteridine diphosphokinase / dihydropteroate synthase
LFFGGGLGNTRNKLTMNAIRLLDAGAEILDIGAESTRPLNHNETSRTHNDETELDKLSSALELLTDLKKKYPQMKISVDSRNPKILNFLVNRFEIAFINDVTGFRNPDMIEIAKRTDCKIIAMHSLSVPVVRDEIIDPAVDPIQILNSWWRMKYADLTSHGIASHRIIFDPGIGFGKSAAQNFYILNNLKAIDSLGCDVLVGHSRKSFLQTITEKSARDRDTETALVSNSLNKSSYQYLRLHDVASTKSALSYG